MKRIFTFFAVLLAFYSFSQIISEPAIDRLDLPPVRVEEVPVMTVGEIDEDLVLPYTILDKTPSFPECEFTTETENRVCFKDELNKHIKKYLKYPKEAKEDKITARVIVFFEITKEGNITNIRNRVTATNKEFNTLFEEEVLRIILKLPKFIPGEQRGRVVNVGYAIPIIFSLSDK